MAKQRFLYRITITDTSSKELREAYERLLKRTSDRKSTLFDELTKCINEFLDSSLRRVEDLESSLSLTETLRSVEHTTAERNIAELKARNADLTEHWIC